MRNFFYISGLILIFSISSIIVVLSTSGYETKKFNEIISKKIIEGNKDISIKINTIKFKFDLKDVSLFLQTNDPEVKFQNLNIPIKSFKIYLNLESLIKSKKKIKKINIVSDKINIEKLKKIIIKTKPSNFNSIISNKIKKGNITANLDLYFNDNSKIKNYIVRGEVDKMEVILTNKLNLINTKFNFFADKSDILIKNIVADIDGILIKEGSLQIEINQFIEINSNFATQVKLNKGNINKFLSIKKDIKYTAKETNIDAKLVHNLDIKFDKTFKVIKYSYNTDGEVDKLSFKLESPIKNFIFEDDLRSINLKDTDISFRHSSDKKNHLDLSGIYQINNFNYHNYNLKSNFYNNVLDIETSLEFNQNLNIDFINYSKKKDKIAKIDLKIKKNKNLINFKEIKYKENKNMIILNDLKIRKSNFISLKKIRVKTIKKNNINNDFNLDFDQNIKIYGNKYDATNLIKYLNKKSKKNTFNKISKNIDIDLEYIETPLSEKLKNFKLIGVVEKGKFTKIISKGDFGNNKYLDISLKNNKIDKKKYLEIYSDLPQPLLSEFNFFRGLSGGKLMYTSIINGDFSNSKLIIEDFKIINAPGVVKLLSLADFGGLADLAEGEGLSFEKLEINMSDNNEILKLEELYAVGPSISVLMDGYREKTGLTSLRGTLVPAKNLNKILSKIPVIGRIIIPKQIGEGLFGVSFKMKGPPGKIKTSINPIKTLTPRFITRALEKKTR